MNTKTRLQTFAVTSAVLLAAIAATSHGDPAPPCKVNLNTATQGQVELLVRTGPVLAARIIAARPLDAQKLDKLQGVGERWLEVNGPHVSFTGPTTCTEKLRAPKK